MPPVAKLIQIVKGGTLGQVKMVAIREHRFPFLVKVNYTTQVYALIVPFILLTCTRSRSTIGIGSMLTLGVLWWKSAATSLI